MKLATALSFLAFVGLCVVFASADPSSPPSSAPPRLFNNDVLKTCPNPTGLVVGNTGGCKITVGNADNTQSDDIFIGTNGGNTQVTIGMATSDISVTGDVVNVKGNTLKLGSNSNILITATGTTLGLGKDGGTTTASILNIDATSTINIGSLVDTITLDADSNIDLSAPGITLTAGTSDLGLFTNSGDIYIDADSGSGDIFLDGDEVFIRPVVSTQISSTAVTITGSDYVTVTGSDFRVASTTTTISGTITDLNSATTTIDGTITNLNSDTTSIDGNTLTVLSTSIALGDTSTTSLSLTVGTNNYIVLEGSVATTLPTISTASATTECNFTVAPAPGTGSTNNAGTISFTAESSATTACVVTVTLAGTGGATPFVVISPMNSVTSQAQPYVSAVSGTDFSVGFATASASGLIQFSYIALFGAAP